MNLDKRIDILILKNQGWSNNQLAKKHNCSPQSISVMYNKIKNMTIEDLEKLRVDNMEE